MAEVTPPQSPVPDARRRSTTPPPALAEGSVSPVPTSTQPKRVSMDSSLPSDAGTKPRPRPSSHSRSSMGDSTHSTMSSVSQDSDWTADNTWLESGEEGRPSWASRNSTNYVATDMEKAYAEAPKHKWKLHRYKHDGTLGFNTLGENKEYKGKSIKKGIEKFKASPHIYAGIAYQTIATSFDKKKQSYMLIKRKGTDLLTANGVHEDDKKKNNMTLLIYQFEQLPPFPDNIMPETDDYTSKMTLSGEPLPPPLLPGRGMGIGDNPGLKIIGDIDPSDINQGHVGDCWLLSAISAIAEFDGAIKKLYRKTGELLDQMPLEDGRVNFYTISLFDLETWEEVDYVIDESLCQSPFHKGQLLGSKPSEDGELWVPYLEKAFAIHCGGWDQIIGGQCTHAWAMMTGCKEQYIIMRSKKTKKWRCMGKYNNETGKCEPQFNSPKKSHWQGLWQVPWPKVGGGGKFSDEMTDDQLYQKMVAWDKDNFIIGAGTKNLDDPLAQKSDKAGGMVDDHAYSVIDCHPQVAGTKIDLLKIRNPWGQGEMEDGDFDDDGPGWDEYPEIKAELNPVVADDGLFYMTKQEFFELFDHVYLSASNMTVFKED